MTVVSRVDLLDGAARICTLSQVSTLRAEDLEGSSSPMASASGITATVGSVGAISRKSTSPVGQRPGPSAVRPRCSDSIELDLRKRLRVTTYADAC